MLGLGLGYVTVCDVTLVCVHVHIVILYSEPALPAGRKRSHGLVTRNEDSPYGYDCSGHVYCLCSQCTHVICHSVDQGIYEIPDGCDFRPLGRAGKRGRPKGSGNCYERYD